MDSVAEGHLMVIWIAMWTAAALLQPMLPKSDRFLGSQPLFQRQLGVA